MSRKEPSYAILGMGRFGRKLTSMLSATGADILIADQKEHKINRYADQVTYAVCLDLANPNAIAEIGLDHIDIVVVDISHHLEAAIMCIMMSRESGVEKIIATASNVRYGEILKRIGADEIIIPEDDAAVRMARRLISEDFMEYYDLGGNLCIIKIRPREDWVGKSIKKLRLPQTENANIIAIEQKGEMNMDFTPDTILEEDAPIALAIRKSQVYNFV